MALQPIHIDISNEISDWKNAVKGKDVRQASVKAFTKLQEQANESVDYIAEKGSVVDQTVLDVQETRIAAEEAVEYANVISDASKKYVDNTAEEYKNYADEKLTQTEQKLAKAEASATAAKESSETALGAAETASAQAKSAQISAGEAKRYAEQCEGAVGFDGTAQTVSAVDKYELGSNNVQGQLDKLADGIKLPGKNISETNIGTLDTPEEKFPIPEVGEKTRTFLGKIKKSMNDWKDFKNGIITLGMLSNQYENSTNKIPTSALVYALKQTTDQLKSNFLKITPAHLNYMGAFVGRITRNASMVSGKQVTLSLTIFSPEAGIAADTPIFYVNGALKGMIGFVLIGNFAIGYVFSTVNEAGDTVFRIRTSSGINAVPGNAEVFIFANGEFV